MRLFGFMKLFGFSKKHSDTDLQNANKTEISREVYTPNHGKLIAMCRSLPPDMPPLTIGKTYAVEYAWISFVYLHEFPNRPFHVSLFSFYINDDEINIYDDFYAIKRFINDTHERYLAVVIYGSLSDERIAEINPTLCRQSVVLVRSEVLNKEYPNTSEQ